MQMQTTLKASCIILLLAFAMAPTTHGQKALSGDAVIRSPYAGSEIVITTTSRLAGAVHSVKWNGQEFIDSHDHGRQLQSASNFDAGSRFTGETFNPTEAGSRFDGAGKTSTSRLLHLIASGNKLQSTSQMAFWLRPGDKSSGNPAKNNTRLSNHLLTKRIVIGHDRFPNVIQYDVTFSLPVDERHTYAQFEALTGYMPPIFSDFFTIELSTGNLTTLSDGPGEQSLPIVFSTRSGSHAMGIYSPQQPSPQFKNAGYGRFRFTPQKVVKWNCVFRVKAPGSGVPPGDYSYRCFAVVGTKAAVAETMVKLYEVVQNSDATHAVN